MIDAPNVTELVYKNYNGWDETLFDSCFLNLKVVYLEVTITNVNAIFEGVKKLVACEEITLDSTKCRFEPKEIMPVHPFGEEDKGEANIPYKDLVKVKQLTIIGDESITGEALVRFVQYKKESSNLQKLERLSLQQCLGVEETAIDELELEVPQFKYRIDKEEEEGSEVDSDSAGSYCSD